MLRGVDPRASQKAIEMSAIVSTKRRALIGRSLLWLEPERPLQSNWPCFQRAQVD